MFIVNKDKTDVYNTKHIVNIYLDTGNSTIKVVAGNVTRGGILGKYKSQDEAEKAFGMLLIGLSNPKETVYQMPTDKSVADKLRAKEVNHHIKGKKTKGHGGS